MERFKSNRNNFRGGFYNKDHEITWKQYSLFKAYDKLFKYSPKHFEKKQFPKSKFDIVISGLDTLEQENLTQKINELFPQLRIYNPQLDDFSQEDAIYNSCMLISYINTSNELDVPENLYDVYSFYMSNNMCQQTYNQRIIAINPSGFDFPDLLLRNSNIVQNTHEALQILNLNIDQFPQRD